MQTLAARPPCSQPPARQSPQRFCPYAARKSARRIRGRCTAHSASSSRTPRAPPSSKRFQADRKSTRLNSSHMSISYAVFCLKKKKKKNINVTRTKKKKKKKKQK